MIKICGDSTIGNAVANQAISGGSSPTSPLQLQLVPMPSLMALYCYAQWHYLGAQEFISQYNWGVFYDDHLLGAVSFGPVSAVETLKGLFGVTEQRGFFEIKRLALSERCPRNSESRVIAVALRLLKKYERVRAVITYADTAQGHEGTIYRATGFTYLGLTDPKMDFWVNGKIQQRGPTRGIKGEWRPRSRKHIFVKVFDSTLELQKHGREQVRSG